MKALLIASFVLGGTLSEPTRTVTTTVLDDVSECKSAMMMAVEHAKLENHVKSSGPNHIRAFKDGRGLEAPTSVNATCKPIKGE